MDPMDRIPKKPRRDPEPAAEPAQEDNPKEDESEKHVEEEERFPAISLDDPLLTRHDHHVRFIVDTSRIGHLARQLPRFGIEGYEFEPTRQATNYFAGIQAALVASTVHFIMFHQRYPDGRFVEKPNFGDKQSIVLNTPEEIAAEIAATRQNLRPPFDFGDMVMRHARLQITTVSQGHHKPSSSEQETKKRHGDELQDDRRRPPPQDELLPAEKEKKLEVIPVEMSSERQCAMEKTLVAVKKEWDILEEERIDRVREDKDEREQERQEREDSGEPGRDMVDDVIDKGESEKKCPFPEYYDKFIRQLPNIPLVGFHLSSLKEVGSTTCVCPLSPRLLDWKKQSLGGVHLNPLYMPCCYSKKKSKEFPYSALCQHLKTPLADSEGMDWHRIALTYLCYLRHE
jgi:hypothetical protein